MEYTKRLKCGCVIRRTDVITSFWIDWCPLHAQAPRLYEACKEVRDNSVLQEQGNGFYLLRLKYSTWQDVCKAIAEVEKK